MEDRIMINAVSFPALLWGALALVSIVAFAVSAYSKLKSPKYNQFSME